MQVGFIGLGNMGGGMAANLLAAGHALTVYNRTAAKARPLVEKGARAGSIAEASAGEAVFTMLADDDAVEQVVFGSGGVLASLRPGGLHISCSTISVALGARLAEAHRNAGQRFVSAPVFGRPEAAASAKLFVVAAGEPAALDAAEPLLGAIGQRSFRFGERPEIANLIKLSGNFLIASVIESLGEAMALVTKAGVDRHAYVDFLTSTLFAAPVYRTYGGLLADRKVSPPGFAAPLGLKDVRLALAAGESLRVPLPLASLVRDRCLALLAQGGEALDWSALGLMATRDSGQETPF
jgi:3-hydroxyisobutyrate dehydrogenase-like beta-hydroxyacid dehydrogenase